MIWPRCEAEYFLCADWTTQISLIWLTKLVFSRTRFGAVSASPLGLTMTLDHFAPDENITRAANAIANLAPRPFARRVTPDQIIAALGEFVDIRPESIRPI